jgi:hypothetical protein
MFITFQRREERKKMEREEVSPWRIGEDKRGCVPMVKTTS